MFALTTAATTVLERVGSPLSDLGHGRAPKWGPGPGACACWHRRHGHPARCVGDRCGCRRYTPSAWALLTVALAVLRGGTQ